MLLRLSVSLVMPIMLLLAAGLSGQEVARLVAQPTQLDLETGQNATFSVRAFDAQGQELEVILRYASPRQALRVGRSDNDGGGRTVTALRAGQYEIVASVFMPGQSPNPASVTIPVTVRWPAIANIEIETGTNTLSAGTTLGHTARAVHADGTAREETRFQWTSSDASVATVDRFGQVTAHGTGTVTITAELEGMSAKVRHQVEAFPAATIEITGGLDQARTGDVLTYEAALRDGAGNVLPDVPVTWTYTFVPDDSINAPGAAGIVDHGKFVGEVAGQYTIIAMAGPLSARAAVDIRPRESIRRVELVGQGRIDDAHTSDLWVFEGADGRDYALTGTWGADGYAYIWDVTDPANIAVTDSIRVDARTVNDVKVSPSARYAAISREGASNRRNGVVILDLSDPAHPSVASVYDEDLTGGVHNMFATDEHLFALSAGDKYIILDMSDIRNPTYVSEYNHPDSRIHDLWVSDGIVYSSEWGNGVVIVDVGNGKWGGTIENPVFVKNIPYPVGRTHAAFPYFQESTGKFYLFLGDEIMGRSGQALEGGTGWEAYDPETGQGGLPSSNMGYIHIIDFTDPENPKDVARYHVEEFGTHNMWIEDDVLYQAYYEGGLRVVDVSGELMGNLAEQGREIAVYKPFDPVGFISNAPMVWGAQLYKGHIFFSDFNSGLWSVKLQPKPRPAS